MAFPYVSELWKETTRPALSWHPCVYTHWFPPAMDDFHQAGFSSKIKTLFLLVSLRVKNPFQITSQSLSMKPPLVRANLGYLMEWGYNDHSLVSFLFWINRSFLRALLVVWSLAVTLLKNVSYKSKRFFRGEWAPFRALSVCLVSWLYEVH